MLAFDIRDAFRGLRRDRLYASLAVLTLALTVGATTAVFSIVNGVLLKPLSYPDPHRLVQIREVWREAASRYPTLPANFRHFDDWRTHARSFAAVAALDYGTTNLIGAGEPMQVSRLRASGTLFDVLGAHVALGRELTRDDERQDRPLVAVVSHALWAERLGRDPAVLGRALTIAGRPHEIVGVLPPGFELPAFDLLGDTGSLNTQVGVIVPLRVDAARVGIIGTHNYPVIARLGPGVTIAKAGAELDVIQRDIAERAEREEHEPVGLRATLTPLGESIVGRTRLPLLLLLGAIAAVVLIACANLANLSLTRAVARTRDVAVRAALGASRRRLVLGVVLEQLMLAAAGGALGLAVARVCLDVFVRTAPVDLPRLHEAALDARVLAFAATLSAMAGLLVSVLPAWRLMRGDVREGLHGTGGHGATDRGGLRTRGALLALQLALSVTLLAAAGLLIASFARLLRVDTGFSTAGVLEVQMAPPAARYGDIALRAALYDRVMQRVRTLPAVQSAAFASQLPLTGETWVDKIARPADLRPGVANPPANYRFVGPEYFATLSMPLLQGRAFEDRDRSRDAVPVVLSARAAAMLWPGQDPIGRRFGRNPEQPEQFEAVGVVADGRTTALELPSPLMAYLPYWANNEGKSILLVRTAADPAAVLPGLRRLVREVDPEIAVADAKPLQSVVDNALAGRRYQMSLFAAFGAAALAIAALGVYATTAYGVSRRRREMNIRVALGARASQVFGLVVGQTAVPVAIGVAVGGIGAVAAGSAMAALLFEVRAHDPRVLGGAALFVTAAGLIAAAAAARQALAIDPAAALRDE